MSSYEPQAGDIIWTDFDPRLGREQGSRRHIACRAMACDSIRFCCADHQPHSPFPIERHFAE